MDGSVTGQWYVSITRPRSALLVNPAKTYEGVRVLRFLLWGVVVAASSKLWSPAQGTSFTAPSLAS